MKKIIFLGILVILVITGWTIFVPPSEDPTEKNFVIGKGEGVHEISQHLKEQNFIKNEFVFETYVWLKKVQSKFMAGEHALRQNMRVWEIISVLTSPGETNERDIKILEGWNNREIANYLDGEGVVNKDVFLEAVLSYKLGNTDYEFLEDKPEGATLEGYLFPDTYKIYKKFPAELLDGKDEASAMANHIIKKMLENFNQKLSAEMRAEIAKNKKTIFEIITMASIIEKEARGEDMAMVADIFWRRIDEGIALQSDATVNYATGKYETQPSLDDLKINSPYNTYKYRGLPAGPIGNPGLEAIRAAVYPKANNYWYFLHTKDGQTIYSRTFDEHKANKLKYLQ
ncbi:endolytic transglycosylase MltG [Candidatus Falkowbacteria bacterium]|nr:endolytic transglycosylase MltG [Candidatus Falkowbacteria bacterium]